VTYTYSESLLLLFCRLELEELRYEQEVLRWQLTQASSGGSVRGDCSCSGDNGQLSSDPDNDRYVTAKHTNIYPTKEDVSFRPCNITSLCGC